MISVIVLLSLVAFQILLGIDCWLYTKWVENTDYSEIAKKGPKRLLPFSGFYFYFKDKFK